MTSTPDCTGAEDTKKESLATSSSEKGLNYIERKSVDREILNRDLLVEVARENDLVVLNTTFEKTDAKLISYPIPGTKDLKQINLEIRNNRSYPVS